MTPVRCLCVKTLAPVHSFVKWSSRVALVPEQAQERKLRHGLLIQGPLPQKLDHKGEHDREESPHERGQGDVEHEPPETGLSGPAAGR